MKESCKEFGEKQNYPTGIQAVVVKGAIRVAIPVAREYMDYKMNGE